jgi:hypothetical protein
MAFEKCAYTCEIGLIVVRMNAIRDFTANRLIWCIEQQAPEQSHKADFLRCYKLSLEAETGLVCTE